MKELSIKEKAKAYDEAKARMSKAYNSNRCTIGFMNEIFPEFKESEDEKVRKEILEYFQQFENEELRGVNISDWIAWLEKQGEHANFINKIQIGDKVTRNEDGVLINLSQLNRVAKKDETQGEQKPSYKVEPKFRVGQTVKKEGFNIGFTIAKIENGFYYNATGDNFPFTDQDNWELVEQKSTYTKEYDFYGTKFIPKFAKGNIIKDKKHGEVSTIEDFSYDTGLYTHTYGQFPITIQDTYEIIEQKPADKVEPKFKVGEWITNGIDVNKIIGIDLEDKNYLFENGRKSDISLTDSISHLWTIKDAKDGDALVRDIYPSEPSIYIFKEFVQQTFTMKVHCSINNKGQFLHNHDVYYYGYAIPLYPATKEQREQLEKAMSDTGYTFDFKTKELKKVEQKPAESKQETKPNGGIVCEDFNEGNGFYKVNLAYLNKEQVEDIENIIKRWNVQKYDEEAIRDCIGVILTDASEKRFVDFNTSLKDCLAWLEKQGEQKPVEWHREDEQNLNACLGYIPDEFLRRWLTDIIHVKYDKPVDKVEPKFKVGDTIYYNSFGELKSMIVANVVTDSTDKQMYEDENGNAVFDKDIIKQKPEWSKYDKLYLDRAIASCMHLGNIDTANWLKSLKERVLPQPKQE